MFIRKILVPVDFSKRSVPALAYAVGMARMSGAEIVVIHVLPAPSAARLAFDAYAGRPLPEPSAAERLAASDQLTALIASVDHSGVVVHHRLSVGDPGATVVCVAVEDNHDLIIIGTHGREGLTVFVAGSVTQVLLSSAPCPVLALGPRGI